MANESEHSKNNHNHAISYSCRVMDGYMRELLRKLEEEVLCALCRRPFKSPKLLPCLHSFCCECLDELSESKTRERRCPSCIPEQADEINIPESGSFDEFPTDSHLERSVENLAEFRRKHVSTDGPLCKSCVKQSGKIVAYCIECDQLLCEGCHTAHKSLLIFKEHRVKLLQDFCLGDYALARKLQLFCKRQGHDKERLEYFCERCEECICQECKAVGGEHEDHLGAVKTLAKAGDDAKNTITQECENAEKRASYLKEEILKIKESEIDFESQVRVAQQELVTRCSKVKSGVHSEDTIDKINKRQDSLLEEMTNKSKSPKHCLEEQIRRIREHSDKLMKTIKSSRDLIKNESCVDILLKKACFLGRLNELTEIEIDIRPTVRAKITFHAYPLLEEHNFSRKDDDPCEGIGEMEMQFSSPSQSTADGDGLANAFDGLLAKFIVTRKTEEGEVAYYPDEDPPSVKFISTSTGQALFWSAKISDQGNGQYEVKYTAKEPGSYKLAIEIGGEHIYKSPYDLLVSPREFNFEKVIGGYGSEQGQFKAPWGVGVSSKDEIAVSDQHNHRVQVFDRDGNFKRSVGEYGSTDGKLHCPQAVAYDEDDNLVVVDCNNNRVQKFDREGNFIMKFGRKGRGDGEFNLPWSVSFDDESNIIVTDKGNNRIQIFSCKGKYVAQFGNEGEEVLSWPVACEMHNDHYFVSDTNNHCIKIFNKQHVYVSKLGIEGQGEGQLIKNQGLLVDRADNVVVCDSWNDRIQLFKLNTDMLSVCSSKQFGSTGNKIGFLNDPSDLAMLSDGRFVVCDHRNHRVQVIA